MTDISAPTPTPAPAPTPAPSAPPPPASTWYTGIEPEYLGHWQNKGWKVDDPIAIARDATKQARELERHFGVPADQLLKMPKADASEADIKAFHQRLGAPADPKDYDFSAVKFNGAPLDDAFQARMRDALAQAYVPKDRASTVVQGMVKFLEDADKAEATEIAGKVAMEQQKLKDSWGQSFEYNKLKAMDGARRLGITPEAVDALEKIVGYAGVMEAMRKVGMATNEAAFVETGILTAGQVTTREGATARLQELRNDPVWSQKLLSKDAATVREWMSLEAQAIGENPLFF